jgi:deoxyribodipyrimidine photo-lyase
MDFMTDERRIERLNAGQALGAAGPVVYWMQADQRAEDNWALIRAIELGNSLGRPVLVGFFAFAVPGAGYLRHYDFMLKGITETAAALRAMGIGFVMRIGDPAAGVPELVREVQAAALVTGQNYLRWGVEARREVAERIDVPMEAVDAGTIVPPRLAYPKACYGAYILRPKLRALREEFVTEFPDAGVRVPWTGDQPAGVDPDDRESIYTVLKLDGSVGAVEQPAGSAEARARLQEFIEDGFKKYADKRNDPTEEATSRLSAY